LAALLLVIAFVPMALEARRSRVNDRALRARGAKEARGDVYRAMQFAYPTCFAAIVVEAWLRERTVTHVFAAGAVVFLAAKALKYWAIASLGSRWTFRILVPPDSSLVASGPYRYLRHPNYVGVAGELMGMALMAQAPVTGTFAFLIFGGLLMARIRVEERALERTGEGRGTT
jgi:methyltransferase